MAWRLACVGCIVVSSLVPCHGWVPARLRVPGPAARTREKVWAPRAQQIAGVRASDHRRVLAASPLEDQPDTAVDEVEWPKQNRQLLGLIGGLGFLETAFLTYEKLVVGDLTSLCSVGGLSLRCGDVLNSEYANIFGVPLTLPGMLAYGAVAALAVSPLLKDDGVVRQGDDLRSRGPILILTTSMATFSAYLMWLLAFKIKAFCPFCLVSAFLSFSMAAITWRTQVVTSATKSAVYKGVSVAITALLSVGIYFITNTSAMIAQQGGFGGGMENAPPVITTHSDSRSLRLANHLHGMGARMYGAFWCSHCFAQKETFGQEAYSQIAYIECAPDGLNSQTSLCKSRKVPGYPTWEIGGELYPGEKTIEQLEEISKLPPPPSQ